MPRRERLQIADVVGGNKKYREVEIPEFGKPVPLPNPAVHQDEPAPPQTRTLEVTIPPEKETEIKMVMREAKMIEYSWHTDRGAVYMDFHGHDPEAGQDYFVRYKEEQEGEGQQRLSGSAVRRRARLVLAELQRLSRRHHTDDHWLLRRHRRLRNFLTN